MHKSTLLKTLGAVAMFSAALTSTSGAMAACVFSEWTNIVPGHALPTITGRDCNGDLSVNVIGAAPNGNTHDFGWSAMQQVGPNSFTASFVDANATNNIRLDIVPQLKSMHVAIETKLNNGQVTNWGADYVLTKTY